MFIVIDLVVFLLMNLMGAVYLFSKETWPLGASSRERISGPEKFILLSLLCAPIAATPLVGMLALRLALWIAFCLIAVFLIHQENPRPLSSPVQLFYGIYLFWLLCGLFYTSNIWMGVRVFMKYLFPWLIMLTAQKFVINSQVFWKGCHCAWKMLLIAVLPVYFYCALGLSLSFLISSLFYYTAGIIDSACVLLLLSYLLWRHEHNPQYVIGGIIALGAPIVASVRTGLVGIVICTAAALTFKYKGKVLVFLLIPFILGSILILKVPQLREKMFYDPQKFEKLSLLDAANRVSWTDINSSGRFFMWERLLTRFYVPSPFGGSGLGSTQAFLYRKNEELGGITVAHSDYVQILCDSGLIGVMLYALSFLFFWIDCLRLYGDSRQSKECRWAALIAGATLAGLAATMMTDNVVNYSMTTLLFPFTFYGIAKGMEQIKNNRISPIKYQKI